MAWALVDPRITPPENTVPIPTKRPPPAPVVRAKVLRDDSPDLEFRYSLLP
jgi:hypothetical protein